MPQVNINAHLQACLPHSSFSSYLQLWVCHSSLLSLAQTAHTAWETWAFLRAHLAASQSLNSCSVLEYLLVSSVDCSAHEGKWHRMYHPAQPGTSKCYLWTQKLCVYHELLILGVVRGFWIVFQSPDQNILGFPNVIALSLSLVNLKVIWQLSLQIDKLKRNLLEVFSEATIFHSCLGLCTEAFGEERHPVELPLICLWPFSRGGFFCKIKRQLQKPSQWAFLLYLCSWAIVQQCWYTERLPPTQHTAH